MIIREFEFTLKDGRKALIRSPKEEDIQGMLDYLYKSAEETDFVLRYPEECSRYTVEGEKELFERINVPVVKRCSFTLWKEKSQVTARLTGITE